MTGGGAAPSAGQKYLRPAAGQGLHECFEYEWSGWPFPDCAFPTTCKHLVGFSLTCVRKGDSPARDHL